MKLLLVTLVVLAVAVVLMAVKVIFKKGGRFPSGHVGDVPELHKRGIDCHASQFYEEEHHRKLSDRIKDDE